MWTISNQSNASIPVNDIPVPQTLAPNTSGQFNVADVLSSLTLSTNIAGGALVVTAMQSFGASQGPWLPVTYNLHPSATETQDGESLPVTMGVFNSGMLLVNVTALGASGSLELSWQDWDGTTYYPAQVLLDAVTATGPYVVPVSEYGVAGRLVWTVGVSATFTATLQMH